MRRRPVWFLAMPMIVCLAVLTGWNRTAADDWPDQSVDFRLNQIMVKLGQIEWELSQVKNRLGSRDRRLTDIDRKLDRIFEEIEKVASTASAVSTESASPAATASEASAASPTSSTAIDPALVGTWRLAHNDFAEGIPKNIRRYLSAEADRAKDRDRADRIERDIEDRVESVIDSFEVFLDKSGFLLLRFETDGIYTDSTKGEGMWLVSGDRLIMTTFNGRTYPSTYSVVEAGLTLTITGDQIGTLFRLEAGRSGRNTRKMIDQAFRYTDRVRLIYTKD